MKRIAFLDEIVEGKPRIVRAGSKEFLVYRQGDTVSICSNLCPHHGASLCDGSIHNGVLVCPRHHARFDIKTGYPLSPPALDGITVYKCEVIDNEVHVGKPLTSLAAPNEVDEKPHFVIIGGGASGIGCAEALRRYGFTGRITVISEEETPPYDRTSLSSEYLTGPIPEGLLLRDPDLHRLLGIDVLVGERAAAVDRTAKVVTCESGRTDEYDKLLLAVGAAAAGRL